MLAHRVELDVANDDHALVGLLEERIAEDVIDVLTVPAHQPGERLRDSLRCLDEPVAVRVLSQELELTPYKTLELIDGTPLVHPRGRRRELAWLQGCMHGEGTH